MHVHPVSTARPEAMVGDLDPEEPQEGPRQAQADEPDLSAVRVTGQDEIALALRQVSERSGIVQEDDARGACLARVLPAHALQVGLAVPPHELHPHDLHGPGLRRHHPLLVHEERDPVGSQCACDVLGCLVVVVAVAREHLARHRGQRLERPPQQRWIALRLHRQEISREEDQVRLARHRTRRDAPQALDGHERTQVRVGDLHDAERPLLACVTPRVRGHLSGVPGAADDEIHGLLARGQRLQQADATHGVGEPGDPGVKPQGSGEDPWQREERPGNEERRWPAHEEPVHKRPHSRTREGREVDVHDGVQGQKHRQHAVKER